LATSWVGELRAKVSRWRLSGNENPDSIKLKTSLYIPKIEIIIFGRGTERGLSKGTLDGIQAYNIYFKWKKNKPHQLAIM